MQRRQEAAEATVFDQTNLLPKRQLITVLCVLAASMFISFVEQNGIGVAIPIIGEELHAEETISWVGTSALIANTIFQVFYGRLSDLYGKWSCDLGVRGLTIAQVGNLSSCPLWYCWPSASLFAAFPSMRLCFSSSAASPVSPMAVLPLCP
jgi:MFS family permease